MKRVWFIIPWVLYGKGVEILVFKSYPVFHKISNRNTNMPLVPTSIRKREREAGRQADFKAFMIILMT